MTMRTFEFLADGVCWKFNMFLAKEAGYFEVFIGLAESDGGVAMGAGNLLADIARRELDVAAAVRTRHFQ